MLAVAAVAIAVAAMRTSVPPDAPIPARREHLRRWSEVHAGIDPAGNRVVGWWLAGMRALAGPLARRGVAPDVVTFLGLWFATAVLLVSSAGGRWLLVAAVLLVAGSVADGLDGTVAVLCGRDSRWGGVLDAMVDRVADVLLVASLAVVAWRAGVPPVRAGGSGAAAVVGLFLLEYLRARAGQAGGHLQVVTVGERPARLVLVGVALWSGGLLPERAGAIAEVGNWAVAAVSVVGLAQLLPAVRRRLR